MNEWISVQDQMPEPGQEILFWHDSVMIGWWYPNMDRFVSYDVGFHRSGVTHWMPLPEPPVLEDK